MIRYPLHAQPGGALHTRFAAMHVFPHAFPLWHVRQHVTRGPWSDCDGVLAVGPDLKGVSVLNSVSHDVERSSTSHSESPELTTCTGGRGRSRSTGAGSSDSSGSGASTSRFPRHPDASTKKIMTEAKPRTNRCPSVFTAFLSLAACGGVNTGQSLEVPAPPEAVLGHGFDSLSGSTRGACVERKPVDRFEQRGANTITQVFYARSKEEIVRQIGFSGGVSFGLFGFGTNLGFEALDRDAHRSTTTFAVVRIQIEAPSETLRDYRLAKHAVETLRREGEDKFYEKCGDGFVAAIRQGGLFLGIVALDMVADEDVKRLSGSGGVSFLGFGVEAGASRETRAFLEKHRARYYIVQNGGGPGGWSSVKQLGRIDHLLQLAQAFEYSIDAGRTVPTHLVVRPYQVASNLPRRSDLWTMIDQRRFLDELAVKYGELKRASAELQDKIAQNTCTSRREAKELEQLRVRYSGLLTAIPQRAQDCLNDPSRRCTGRGLDLVDARTHQAALELCTVPGKNSECRRWQLTSLVAQVPPRSQRLDGMDPSPSISVMLDRQRVPLAGKTADSSYLLNKVYAGPGAKVVVRISNGARESALAAFMSGGVALAVSGAAMDTLSGELPTILPNGTWTLEKGQVKVVFQARCVE
jgi:hypothetical protein